MLPSTVSRIRLSWMLIASIMIASCTQSSESLSAELAEDLADERPVVVASTVPEPFTDVEGDESGAVSRAGGDEGRMDVLVHAKSAFDPWTEPTDEATWKEMRATYDAMVVYSPYFDQRLELFEETFVYEDLYGLKVDSSTDTRAYDHPDWVLRSAEDRPVYIPWGCDVPAGCPQFAADVGHPEFQDAFVAEIADLVGRGYSGVLIDDVNLEWRFSDRDGTRLTPINPRTRQPMRLSQWRADVVELLERVRDEFPDTKIMHNSIWFADSPEFESSLIDRQIAAADVIMLERGATDAGLAAGDGKFGFRTFVAFIDRVHRLGGNVLLLDETATTNREQVFNLATGLLVNDGGDLVSTEDYALMAPESIWDGFSTDLGAALGPHVEDGGVWRREFERGVVVLNEPGRDETTVDLGDEYSTADGRVVTEVRLDAHAAMILYRIDD